ncbi:penicillin-binding transpeptidase domain-containing protein [Pectobacterium aroidearum]|uniref:penicillin-binding transpeptidase domain-containing protein n=1 Tax=Pectobacterium aroidearum TaxID=1201031 RepID=UPI003018DA6A
MAVVNKKNVNKNARTYFNPYRYQLVCAGIAVFLVTLLVRTADLQIVKSKMLEHEADLRSLRTTVITASRGTITDRNGNPLAVSVPSKDIIADPARVIESSPDIKNPKWQYLASVLNTTPEGIYHDILEHPKRHFLFIKKNVDLETSSGINNLHLSGISEEDDEKRFYPASEAAAPLIGIVGAENDGVEGIEHSYNAILQGVSGKKTYRQDSLGHQISVSNDDEPPLAPQVQLSIDSFEQYVVYTALKKGVLLNKAESGTAVLVKIETGEILAMASYPSFNPNNFATATPVEMRNVAINDSFEPGSTVKPLVVLAGLEHHIIQPNTLLNTSPYQINGHLIRDVGVWPRLTITGILQKSSDIGVSHIALAMPASVLVNLYHDFGLGKSTNLGLTGESVGYFPLHRQRWSDIERATFSFGYGLRVTPLQIAREYATLGAFGFYRNLSITKVTPPVTGVQVADPDTVRTVVHMMESDVLPGGTGVKAAIPGYCMATKTGTAEKLGEKGKYDGGYVNYMAGVVPVAHPTLALVVLVNNPTAGAHFGGSVAAPIFGDILKSVLPHMNIPPDCLK